MNSIRLYSALLISSIASVGPIMSANVSDEQLLWYAADEGDEATVRQLLEKRPNIDELDDVFHSTPLFAAIKNGHGGIVKLLLDAGADINVGSESISDSPALHGWGIEAQPGRIATIPLVYAVKQGNIDIVRKLLQHGADPNLSDIAGHSIGENETILSDAIGSDNNSGALVDLLLQAGANPEGHTSSEHPLYTAALQDKEELVEELLKHGADPDRLNPVSSWPALLGALKSRSGDAVRVLLTYGAKVGDWAQQLSAEEKRILEETQAEVGQKRRRAIRKGLSHFPKDITGLIEEFAATSIVREGQ